ncbi:hypothetical protein DVA67_027620 [Solirubrobacter sp. CPCC 204708]|uniref:Uncharacterized protein n=1 Tax=Solirubrobacter deserti TaxID=2282478 RepID=A0ABT4RJV9_9ACTN|nr:hypothetical protein [Solirubrobacter deserti]MBE2319769.1 hypothetical protein [Solirubrobacter deserti]MDA0138748.1 hypothetical protein [Solirubrobacter deserti]
MRHHPGPYLAALVFFGLAEAAEARKVKIRQQGAPEVTLTVPAGWKVQERRTATVLTRSGRRIVLYQCPLTRHTGVTVNMAGRRARAGYVPIRGGSCLGITGGSLRFARSLRPVLGEGGRTPRSDMAAEQLARAARERTLAQPRMVGTATAVPFGIDAPIESAFAYDGGYAYQSVRFRGLSYQSVLDSDAGYVRHPGQTCWDGGYDPDEDDALEPRLELEDWDAPPSTKTSWHVSYKPIITLPDRSRLVRWTGFVADGEAVIGADGLLQRVRIVDHHQARGRTSWRTVEVVFTGFPATIARVAPQPSC